MRLAGPPLTLAVYPARTRSNRNFRSHDLSALDRCYLPPALTGLLDEAPLRVEEFVEDDNRGAVSPGPVATLDGLPFYLSVKGVGSTIDPFSTRPLDREHGATLTSDPRVLEGLRNPKVPLPDGETDRLITGELWLRGSPYGGQGLSHATIALRLSERADLTSLRGFKIAPVLKVSYLPSELEERLRTLHWYRRFSGPMVQELRLVPSNIRIYFHAKHTVGQDVHHLFDRFGLASGAQALRFETRFIRSTVAMLTLFARTLTKIEGTDRYRGLDFHDVWLDKDAVLSPSGEVYFVDLEGIEEVEVAEHEVREKIEDQIFRSLYEFMFAYEQIDQERRHRFGDTGSRKQRFASLFEEAVREDPWVRALSTPGKLELEVRNGLAVEGLYTTFPFVDH